MTNRGKDENRGEAFTRGLLRWNERDNKRPMPWKGEKDPYRIWLSEIILQQTRVEQGLKYYENFIKTFPAVHDLAAAPEQQVFKLWEGLGYYTRCKNLIATARAIASELNGVFPDSYEGIVQLKGVGPYTAAAIASFAYNLPHAVLDGNVFRVLSRIFDIELPIDSTEGKKYFTELAQSLLPAGQAGVYNQAIMDFGATVCKPVPECAVCFFNNQCAAFLQNRQALLPVKAKQTKVKERWFNYIVLQHNNQWAIRQRTGQDIWQSLFEFVLVETAKGEKKKEVLQQFSAGYGLAAGEYTLLEVTGEHTQRLSHQLIHFRFFVLDLQRQVAVNGLQWVPKQDLTNYPFPKTVQQFINAHLTLL